MSLWEMSICGGIFITVIVLIRGLFRKQFPGKIFQILWLAAVLRLLLPVAVPWQYSVYSMIQRCMEEISDCGSSENIVQNEMFGNAAAETEAIEEVSLTAESQENDAAVAAQNAWQDAAAFVNKSWQEITRMVKEQPSPIWVCIYLLGAVLFTLYYVLSYYRWHKELQTSLPVENPQIQAWAEALPLRRKVSVRQWEGTATPFTCGVLRPVILLPKSLAEEAPRQLKFVLAHEYMHIRRYDAVKKIVLLFTCCLHWFNPLVWVMCILANRDMELDCDEHVIKYLGRDSRADYAYALLDMEEQRSVFLSWGNSFSKNAMEERVVAIMKGNKKSIAVGILSGVMTVGVIMAFVTSAFAMDKSQKASQVYTDSSETYDVKAEGGRVYVSKGTAGQSAAVNEDVEEQSVYVSKGTAGQSAAVNEDMEEQSAAVEDISSDIAYAIESTVEQYAGAENSENIAYAYDEGDASEGVNGHLDLGLPEEYVSLGVTADLHTGTWEYQGKKVAVFYDKDRWLLTADVSPKDAVYLEVCRDKEGKIEQIKNCSKKEMQNILKKKGLVF